jgi:hypothetical protein
VPAGVPSQCFAGGSVVNIAIIAVEVQPAISG